MKYILLDFVVFATILVGCTNTSSKKSTGKIGDKNIFNMSTVAPNNYLDSMARLFVKTSNCPSCTYEIYIQKKDDDDFYLSFKSFPKNSKHKSKKTPLICTIDSTTFFVYTGLEDFVSFENGYNNRPYSSAYDYLLSWTIKKDFDTTFIIQDVHEGFIPGNLRQTVKFIESH